MLFRKWGALVLHQIWSSLHFFSFFTAAIVDNMKLLKHQKLDKMIYQQSEHSVCTRNYSYHFWNNIERKFEHWVLPWISLLWQTRAIWIPRKKIKLPQNTNIFLWPVSNFYTLITGILTHSWFEIMEFIQNYDRFYFLALENDCEVKVVTLQEKKTIFLNICVEWKLKLSWIKVLDCLILEELINSKLKYSS